MLGNRALPMAIACLLLCLAAGLASAADIVTVPTANQLKAGEIDVAAYYIGVDQEGLIAPLRPLGIDFVRVQTLYAGLTDKIELDVHRYDVDVLGVKTIFNSTYLLQSETPQRPAVVIGARDISREYGHASYFLSAAKTLNPPLSGPPTKPIFRLHASLGTEDNTLFGEGRHDGLFGGLQIVLRPGNPHVGAIALYDGQDIITGLTYTPTPAWPTLKAGTFGDHWWVGINYTFNAK